MTAVSTRLEHPIDVMVLIHKALRAEAARAEKIARDLEEGASLQPFKLAFNSWATALVYHAEAELGIDLAGAESSLPETTRRGPRWSLLSALMAHEDEEHRELVERIESVLTILEEDIGKTSIITRTKQHLHGEVLALRVTQDDHLETEEALVLPLVRDILSDQRQLEVAKGLVIDEQAQDPRWVLEWVSRDLAPNEILLLGELEARINGQSAAAPP